MKEIPNITNSTFTYVRLQALNWIEYGLASTNNVQSRVGGLIAVLWKSKREHQPLILNCSGVTALADHALEDVRSAGSSAEVPLVFFLATSNLAEELRGAIDRHARTWEHPSGTFICIIDRGGIELHASEVQELLEQARRAEGECIQHLVSNCYKAQELRLTSTPLLASGVFNARKLICQPISFVWIVLAMLDTLRIALDLNPPRRACLLSVSLRASPFAAALAFLYDAPIEVEIVDHLGPHYAILEEHSLRKDGSDLDYIYIGDFLIGGTELKLATNYALNRGCRLQHALIIGSWLDPRAYRLDSTYIASLVRLQELRPDVTYTFS